MATCLLLLLKEHFTPDVLTAQYSQTGKYVFSSAISISNVRNSFLQLRDHKMLSWETLQPGKASYIENFLPSVNFQHRILFFLPYFISGMLLTQVSTMTKYLSAIAHKGTIQAYRWSFSYANTPHLSSWFFKFLTLFFSFSKSVSQFSPGTQISACLCLLNVVIKGMYHHA